MVTLVTSLLLAAAVPVSAAAVYDLPCTPVGVYPPVGIDLPAGPAPVGELRGPSLYVVDTDIRPGRARLYLDGTFIGRADDFDGGPDFLYLEPGRYRLEARLGGYRTAVFEIAASARCRGDIRHRMERVAGEDKERRSEGPAEPSPLARIFAPSAPAVVSPVDETARRPAASGSSSTSGELRTAAAGRLRLQVQPAAASVYLDGVFVASGAELEQLEQPLAVAPGRHLVEALLPGREPASEEVRLAPGELVTVDLTVDANGS